MDFRFNLGDEVYDRAASSNGIVIMRKYQEASDGSGRYYYLGYSSGSGTPQYDWTHEFWLQDGHKIE